MALQRPTGARKSTKTRTNKLTTQNRSSRKRKFARSTQFFSSLLEPLEDLQQEQQSTQNRFVRPVRKRSQTIPNRFAGFQAQSLNVPVDFPLLQRIALPVTPWNPRKRPS